MNKSHQSQGLKRGPVGRLTTNKMTLMAIVLAMLIIFSFMPALNFGNIVQIGIGFIGTAFAGILFGPWYAAIIAMANDLITFFINGSGFFFPGFTLSAGLGAWIYGFILWRRPITWQRILLAVTLVTLIVNIGLNSIWIRIMYDQAWNVFFPMRVLKNLVSLPLNTLILTVLFKLPTVQKLIRKYEF